MLKIKHKYHLDFPHFTLTPRRLEFSPVSPDQDELMQAIEADSDNIWELSERPDMGELSQFWSEVEEDISRDPTWFKLDAEK